MTIEIILLPLKISATELNKMQKKESVTFPV